MTGQDIYNEACALIDDVDEDNVPETDNEGKAISLINNYQRELAKYDNTILTIGDKITALTDELAISDEAAGALVCALAYEFAKADGNDAQAKEKRERYYELRNGIRCGETDIEDKINAKSGMQ